MLAAGVGIPIMGALLANFGARIGSPIAASLTLFLTAAPIMLAGLALTGGAPRREAFLAIQPVYYLSGVFFSLYLIGMVFSAPRIGLGTAVFLVLLGQLYSATAIDHFGLFGADVTPVTGRGVLGLALMTAGVYFARKVS